jgi:hypothetical protein
MHVLSSQMSVRKVDPQLDNKALQVLDRFVASVQGSKYVHARSVGGRSLDVVCRVISVCLGRRARMDGVNDVVPGSG